MLHIASFLLVNCSMQMQGRVAIEAWISDSWGRNMRCIEAVEKDKDDERAIQFPLSVEWLPSGKCLAVKYNGMLYTILVP